MRLTILTVSVLILASSAAMAQDRAKAQKLASELGVSKWALFTCARSAGGRPDRDADQAQRKAFAKAMFGCLSEKNPALTKEHFVATLKQMRP